LTRASIIRLWFSLAVAVVAAALADPLLEALSNAGRFGPGTFTDHSNLDVLPAFVAGAAAIAVHLVLRTKAALAGWHEADRALRVGLARILPFTFCVQILVLYTMETCEQLVAYGHVLGENLWWGAPPAISLLVHAVMCVVVCIVGMHVVRMLAAATLHVIRSWQAVQCRRARPSVRCRRTYHVARANLHPALRSIGERAPPYAL